jgi:hypothetical protein
MSDFANAISGSNEDMFRPRHGGVSMDLQSGIAHFDGGSFKIPQMELNNLRQQDNFKPATTSPDVALKPPSMLPMILYTGLAIFFIYCNKK